MREFGSFANHALIKKQCINKDDVEAISLGEAIESRSERVRIHRCNAGRMTRKRFVGVLILKFVKQSGNQLVSRESSNGAEIDEIDHGIILKYGTTSPYDGSSSTTCQTEHHKQRHYLSRDHLLRS